MAVDEQFLTLMPTLYPGWKATNPRLYASLDAMWKAFSDLAHNKTPAVNGQKHFSPPVSSTGTANQVPFAPATDRATAVRHTRPVRRRHCQGHLLWFRKMLECLSFALHVAWHKLFLSRAHGLLRRLLTIFTA